MTFPFRFLRTSAATANSGDLRLAARSDTQWERRIFQAPALPSPRLPAVESVFPSDFRFKDRKRP